MDATTHAGPQAALQAVRSAIAHLADPEIPVVGLAELGISSAAKGGTLSVDSSKLDKILVSRFDDIATLFSGAGGLAAPAQPGLVDLQRARIGDQTGGRVGYCLETDDFARDHARFTKRGVRFLEAPRHEPYGSVAVFEDLYGNKWDLIEPKG